MKYLVWILLSVFLSSCSRCSKIFPESLQFNKQVKTESLKLFDGKELFKFEELDDKVLATSGDFEVLFEDIKEDNYLQSLLEQKKKIVKQVNNKEVNPESYLLSGVETKIFQRQLDLAEERIKEKALKIELDRLDMSRHQYITQYVYEKLKSDLSDKEVEEYLERNLSPSGDKREWAIRRIIKKNTKKYLNYTLEKYILDLPIRVNLKPPQFDIELKKEWAPHWGPQSATYKVIIFSGAKNHGDKVLLKDILELKKSYKNLYVAYRPLVGKGFQELASYIHMCVWNLHKDLFWDFLSQAVGDYKEKTEEKMYSIANQMNMDEVSLKTCVLDKRYNEVMEYHKKYAQYLQISSGPVVFVSGEVLYGSVKVEEIDRILKRKMNLPYAGSWQ